MRVKNYQERVRIGTLLFEAMRKKGHTYMTIANMTGLSVATVQKIMDGCYNVGIDELTAIANVLDVKLNFN